MTIQNLIQGIHDCDNGIVTFNLGNTRSFLYKIKWYPLRATINHSRDLAGENPDLTTDQALLTLVNLELWVRIAEINFANNFPLPIDFDNTTVEVKKLINILYDIMSN